MAAAVSRDDSGSPLVSCDVFYKDLGEIPHVRLKSVRRFFSSDDAQKVYAFVVGHFQKDWVSAEDPYWQRKVGREIEVRRIQRKQVGAEILPRTLLVARRWNGETKKYEILHVLVLFNKSFSVNIKGKKIYEGVLEEGRLNKLKVAYDLQTGRFCALRQSKEIDKNDMILTANELKSKIKRVFKDRILIEGIHTKTGGEARYFTAHHLFWGDALDFFMREDRKFDDSQKLRIARILFVQLNAIHTAGIAHRDIKPENVLVDINGDPVISDWDFATTSIGKYQRGELVYCTQGFIPRGKDVKKYSKLALDRYALALSLQEIFGIGWSREGWRGTKCFDSPLRPVLDAILTDPEHFSSEWAIARIDALIVAQEKQAGGGAAGPA